MHGFKTFALFVALFIACGASVSYVHMSYWNIISGTSVAIWAVFYTVFGVVYAILMGFVLAELLHRFHNIRRDISNEVNALQCIRDYLIYINHNEHVKDDIIDALSRYVEYVLLRDWDEMKRYSRASLGSNTDTPDEIYAIMRGVERIKIHDESDLMTMEKIIEKIAEVTTFRTDRFDLSKQNLSPMIRLLLLFMASVVIVGMVLVPVQSLHIHQFMSLSMLTALFLLNIVIEDLNYPYEGLWNISTDAFYDMKEKLKSHWPEFSPAQRGATDPRP